MIDLVLHKNNNFIPPLESTSDEQFQIVQAFLTLMLTKLGSIGMDSEVGSIFELGSRNITDARFMVSEIIYDTLKTMKGSYNIINATLTSLEDVEDSISVKITITTTLGETSINVTI